MGSLSERASETAEQPSLGSGGKGPRAGLTEYPLHLLYGWWRIGPDAISSTETASLASNPTSLEDINPSQLLPVSPDPFGPGAAESLLQFPDLELSSHLSSPHGHIFCSKSWLSRTKPSALVFPFKLRTRLPEVCEGTPCYPTPCTAGSPASPSAPAMSRTGQSQAHTPVLHSSVPSTEEVRVLYRILYLC